MGQGIRTVLAQIVADRLQVDHGVVRVELLDTDRTPYGTGSYASRSTVTAGSALVQATDEIITLTKQVAAVEFEVAEEDLEYIDGSVRVQGSPGFRMSIFEAAARLHPITAPDYGRERPGLVADSVFDVERVVYPCGANLAVVQVCPDTGQVTVEHLLLLYDIGRAINPMLVAGQMEGGAIQAIGGTLYEEFAYDADGNPLSASFMDYLLPTLSETPVMETIVGESAPTATNPLGTKGAGRGRRPRGGRSDRNSSRASVGSTRSGDRGADPSRGSDRSGAQPGLAVGSTRYATMVVRAVPPEGLKLPHSCCVVEGGSRPVFLGECGQVCQLYTVVYGKYHRTDLSIWR